MIARDADRLDTMIRDFFLAENARLDERTRAVLGQTLTATVGGIARAIARHAARLLTGWGEPDAADAIIVAAGTVVARLSASGLLRDPELMAELLDRVRLDLLGEAVPLAFTGGEQPSLLARLASAPDPVVARAAVALAAALARRRSAAEDGAVAADDLPAELHQRIAWWTAAVLVEASDAPNATRAVVDAVARNLGAHDEGERPEAAARRAAAAIDARPEELSELLVEAIGGRQLLLFAALLAHAIGCDVDQVRAATLDRDGERLWAMLRAVDADRATIARIGLALAEADPVRNLDAFAAELDAIAAMPVDAARFTLVRILLPRDLRFAATALVRGDRE